MKNKAADGLRGIAAFNVAACHFAAAFLPILLHNSFPTTFPENKDPGRLFEIIASPAFSIFYNGWWAVLIFFVLSGYVLTLPYFRETSNAKNALERRLWGRYLRLNVPIFAATVIGFCAFKLGLFSNVLAGQAAGSGWLSGYLSQGVTGFDAVKQAIYESVFFGKSALIPPLWTLKVEFIGSIYVLLFYISKPKSAVVIPMIAAIALIYIVHQKESIFYFAIFAGSLINYIKATKTFNPIFFLSGLYFGGYQSGTFAYYYLPDVNFLGNEIWDAKTFYNVVGAVLVTIPVVQGFGSKVFESRLFQFLGKISFSLYLTHFIVLGTAASFVYIRLPNTRLMLVLEFLIYVGVCVLISLIFEKFVDRRAISISHAFTSRIFFRQNKSAMDSRISPLALQNS